jgi:ADP-ribose pyrophosphatase YjhB (NUDIX family)
MRAVALIHGGRGVLLERAQGPGAPRGMWDLPGVLLPPGADARRFLERRLRERGLRVAVGAPLATVEHAITFRRIRSTAYEARLEDHGSDLREEGSETSSRRWAEKDELAGIPLGAAARRLLCAVLRT